jgi:hypothetical protein
MQPTGGFISILPKSAAPEPSRSHPSSSPPAREEREESFADLFCDKSPPESFSNLVEDYLAVPAGTEDLKEEKAAGGPAMPIREYPAPQEELDLHRLTGPEAQRKIEAFILYARNLGLLTLRIITGRGLHSAGPAILPEVAESKLLDLKERGMVLNFRWDGKSKERSGSITVYLKRG